MDAAPAAIPVKPNIAARIAITRNITVQRSIVLHLKGEQIWFTDSLLSSVLCKRVNIYFVKIIPDPCRTSSTTNFGYNLYITVCSKNQCYEEEFFITHRQEYRTGYSI